MKNASNFIPIFKDKLHIYALILIANWIERLQIRYVRMGLGQGTVQLFIINTLLHKEQLANAIEYQTSSGLAHWMIQKPHVECLQ